MSVLNISYQEFQAVWIREQCTATKDDMVGVLHIDGIESAAEAMPINSPTGKRVFNGTYTAIDTIRPYMFARMQLTGK